MASKRTQILDALVDRIKTIPSYSALGSVNAGVRPWATVRDQPSVDVVLGSEEREQQPSFQAKRACDASVYVWGRLGHDQQAEDIAEEIENALRDEMTLGGLVTALYSTGLDSDEGTLAAEGRGPLRIVMLTLRYHATEM